MDTVGFAFFIIFGAGLSWYALREAKRGQESRHWPTTFGIVKKCGVSGHTDEQGTTYRTTIVYEYEIEGTTLTGDRRSFLDWCSSKRQAHQIAALYPVGSQVTVYYRPEKPEICVLEPGVGGEAWLFFAVSLAFFLLGLSGILGFVKIG